METVAFRTDWSLFRKVDCVGVVNLTDTETAMMSVSKACCGTHSGSAEAAKHDETVAWTLIVTS